MKPPMRKGATPAQYNERLPRGKADADGAMSIDPGDRTEDLNVMRTPFPVRGAEELKKGGKITKVAGKPVGKEDGLIAVQKGEHVIRKAAAEKYGPVRMSAVNRGTATITTKGKR